MTSYAHILERRSELLLLDLHWLVSDLLQEFDEWFRIPLRDRTAFARRCVEFFEWEATTPPEMPARIVYERFEALCADLERRGEDIDRLCLWLACGKSRYVLDLPGRGRESLWSPTLKYWCFRGTPESSPLNEPPLSDFLASHDREVWRPSREFKDRWRVREKTWESEGSDAVRSALDDRIFAALVKLRGEPPHLPLGQFHRFVLDRQWWRRYRGALSDDDHETLLSELVRHLQDTRQAGELDWSHVCRLDEAFGLEGIPDFDAVRRDW